MLAASATPHVTTSIIREVSAVIADVVIDVFLNVIIVSTVVIDNFLVFTVRVETRRNNRRDAEGTGNILQ